MVDAKKKKLSSLHSRNELRVCLVILRGALTLKCNLETWIPSRSRRSSFYNTDEKNAGLAECSHNTMSLVKQRWSVITVL